VVIIIAVAGAIFYFWKNSISPKFTTVIVKRGTITQEISASGKVQPPQTLNLYFKTGGKLMELNVQTGDTVNTGQILARQDTTQLEKQLQQAQAGVQVAQAKLDQLLAGASSENIAVARTNLNNAQTALANAQAANNIARKNAINAISDAYVKADDAIHNYTDRLFQDPLGANPDFEIKITTAANIHYIITENNADKK